MYLWLSQIFYNLEYILHILSMENQADIFKSDLSRIIYELIDFIELKKREKLERITVQIASHILAIFQIKTIFSLQESSQELKESIYNAVIRIEYKQFEALQQIRRSVQSCIYVLLEGAIKRIGRLFRMVTNAFNRSYAYQQPEANANNRQQSLKIFSDETGQNYKCLKKVKLFRLEKWLYDEILLILTKNDRELLNSFICKALKMPSANLEDLHLENRLQTIEEKKGKTLSINQQCLYIIKKGLVQLEYPQSKIKIQLNDGSTLKFSKNNNFVVRIVQNTVFFALQKKILKELYKEYPNFQEQLNHQCEQVYKTRHQLLVKSPRCITLPSNSPQYSYTNMKLNPRASKRFRKSTTANNQNSQLQVKEFVSNLPYQKLIQSEQFIEKCKKEKLEIKKRKCDKITSYLKKIQLKKQKKHDRMFQLRMKSIADKAVVSSNSNPIKKLRQSGILKFNFFDTAIDDEQPQNTPNSQNSTKQALLSPSDTGIINSFIKNSRRYQCEISYLLNSSQKQNNFIKPTKNQHKNQGNIFCHKMLKDMLKKYTQPNIETAETQFDQTNNRMSHQTTTASSPTYYNKFIEEFLPLRSSQTNIVKKTILKRLKSGKVVRRY